MENEIKKAENQVAVATASDQATAMLSVFREVAMSPDADKKIDIIRAMMEMQRDLVRDQDERENRERARHAKTSYDMAFTKMKPKLPVVIKTHENKQTVSKYAKLGDINVEIDPVLAEFGFASSMKILSQNETSVTVRTELRHEGGHMEETTIVMPLDNKGPSGTVNKTGPHALMSAIEYAKRGGLSALLNVSTGDDKDGNQDSDTITVEQAADLDLRLRALSEQALPNFLKWAKVESLTDILAKKYSASESAVGDMEKTVAKKKVAA